MLRGQFSVTIQPRMNLSHLVQRSLEGNRKPALATATGLIIVIAVVDWMVKPNLGIGFLYFLPILLASRFLTRWQVAATTILCAFLREAFTPAVHGWISVPRTFLVWVGFLGVGLFVRELARNQELELEHVREMAVEVSRRAAAEEQLRVLVETSPAAILLADQQGNIVLFNRAAEGMLAADGKPLHGRNIRDFLPSLSGLQDEAAATYFRSALECRALRDNGDLFQTQVLFSTFDISGGRYLAAIIFDTSEQMREREESGLKRLLSGTEIAVAAVSHEIRNMCGAATVVHSNLARMPALRGNEDFDALGVLIEGLRRLASADLKQKDARSKSVTDLQKCLEDLRIVIEPSFREDQIDFSWSVPAQVPKVEGEHHSLLQVFLNMALNSERAMAESPRKQFSVKVEVLDRHILVHLTDTGRGLVDASRLFRPFQEGASGAGLGLYVSRAIVRSFSGDLRHEPQAQGTGFVVELKRANG